MSMTDQSSLVIKLKKFMNDAVVVSQTFSGEEAVNINDSFDFSQQVRSMAKQGLVSFERNADGWTVTKEHTNAPIPDPELPDDLRSAVEFRLNEIRLLLSAKMKDGRYKAMALSELEKCELLIGGFIRRS